MSLIRRSHFPCLFPDAPHKAPQHPAVQAWLRLELQYTQHPKALREMARLMEKAIARKPLEINLSAIDPVTLGNVPTHLIERLAGNLARLRLPDDCPRDIAAHWAGALTEHQVEILPAHLWPDRPRLTRTPPRPPIRRDSRLMAEALLETAHSPAVPDRHAFIHRAGRAPQVPRMMTKVSPPQVPDTVATSDTTPLKSTAAPEIEAAKQATRVLRAWVRQYSDGEGQDSRTAMTSADADAVAKALLSARSGGFDVRIERAIRSTQALLAGRQPGKPQTLSWDQADTMLLAVFGREGDSIARSA